MIDIIYLSCFIISAVPVAFERLRFSIAVLVFDRLLNNA